MRVGKAVLILLMLLPAPGMAQIVCSGVTNCLSSMSGSMSPGSWAEFTSVNLVASDTLIGSKGPGLGNRTPYAITGAWDATHHQLHFIGSDHGEWQCKHAVYDAATNTWSHGADAELTGEGTVNHQPNNNACNHSFDGVNIDPATQKLYWYAHGTTYWTLAYGASTWVEIPANQWVPHSSGPNFPGTAFWSGALTGTAGSGAWFLYNSESYWGGTEPQSNGNGWAGQTVVNDITNTSLWYDLAGFNYPAQTECYTYQSAADYSPTFNVGIFGGGGACGNRIWRLNADRTITRLTDFPSVNWGIQYANEALDPVSGKFIFLRSDQMYELDPTGSTGTWTTMDSSHNPSPSYDVGFPNDPNLDNVFSTPISTYGVIMYVTCGSSDCRTFLYKHSPSAPGSSPQVALFFRLLLLAAALPALVTNRAAIGRIPEKVRERVHLWRSR